MFFTLTAAIILLTTYTCVGCTVERKVLSPSYDNMPYSFGIKMILLKVFIPLLPIVWLYNPMDS